jgi:hypothetical protein
MLKEIFSRLEVAGKTAMGIVTNPKLMEPFQIDLMIIHRPAPRTLEANCE